MNLLSLYSGIGSHAIAAQRAGIPTVAFCDSNPFCRSVLTKHWPNVYQFRSDTEVTHEAFTRLKLPSPTIIAGGFPCQPYSESGKQRGETDPRNRWPEMYRIVAEFLPEWVVGENVRGLVNSGALDRLCDDLQRLGYHVGVLLLLTGFVVGAPHTRYRVLVLARRGVPLAQTFQDIPRAYQDLRQQLQWPAPPGQPQHSWEPSRTVTEDSRLRQRRIRALGNSTVPQVLIPLYQEIVREYRDQGRSDETTEERLAYTNRV